MGAALTYARRYALFTLVGIAGEDDLDAPDLQNLEVSRRIEAPANPRNRNSDDTHASFTTAHSSKRQQSIEGVLDADNSRAIRLQIQSDIDALTTIEDLQLRATDILKTKNRLGANDAKLIEQAFTDKIAALQDKTSVTNAYTPVENSRPSDTSQAARPDTPAPVGSPKKKRKKPAKSDRDVSGETVVPNAVAVESVSAKPPIDKIEHPKIDKSALALGEPRRHRDKDHLRFVASQPCLICDRSPSDAHHLRFAQPRAMGRKTSDEFSVPLCRAHHRENHRHGDELAWWGRTTIDPIEESQRLWAKTHMNE